MICGEILVEVMTVNKDQTFLQPGPLIGPYPSGAPAIFISQAALMGSKCGIISQVGNDDFGKLNLKRLEKDGVDISYVQISPKYTTGTAFVTYFKDGSRQFIYHFSEAACGYIDSTQIDVMAFADCKYFHVMGCSLAASPAIRESVLYCLKLAKNQGAKITFDPNIRPELFEDMSIKEAYELLLKESDVILSGKSEFEQLFPRESIKMDDHNNNHVVKQLLSEKQNRIVVIKDGARGVNVYSDDDAFYLPSMAVEEVDPTGAGDCFDGAFVACLEQGLTLRDAAKYANVAGALGVTAKGPMEGNSTRMAIESELEKQTFEVIQI
jgi:sugar/nucleoside kinase (ribokinase family)